MFDILDLTFPEEITDLILSYCPLKDLYLTEPHVSRVYRPIKNPNGYRKPTYMFLNSVNEDRLNSIDIPNGVKLSCTDDYDVRQKLFIEIINETISNSHAVCKAGLKALLRNDNLTPQMYQYLIMHFLTQLTEIFFTALKYRVEGLRNGVGCVYANLLEKICECADFEILHQPILELMIKEFDANKPLILVLHENRLCFLNIWEHLSKNKAHDETLMRKLYGYTACSYG